jgi:LacI family transcriptional regulator
MTNMREIAKEAGVGIATVSRYINNTGYVSLESKMKIEKVIKKLNYQPNELARAIFTKNTKTFGLLVPNISNPFFNEMALVIEEHANRLGYTIFLCNTNDDEKKEQDYISVLNGHRVAGIITIRSQCRKEYTDLDIPVVSFENFISEHTVTVSSNNYNGGVLAFNELFESGCKNIAHIKGPEYYEAANERCRGFLAAAREKNLDIDIIQFDTDFQRKMLEAHIKKLQNIEKYDGVFVFNDIAAASVIRYFQKRNIQVPKQVKVIGFDNSYIGEFLYPALTTINQPVDKLGKTLVESLMKLINGEKIEEKKIVIETELIVRESTLINSNILSSFN